MNKEIVDYAGNNKNFPITLDEILEMKSFQSILDVCLKFDEKFFKAQWLFEKVYYFE